MRPYWFYHRHFRLVDVGDLVEVWNARASVRSSDGQVRLAIVTEKTDAELSFRKHETLGEPWITIDERGPWRWRILKKKNLHSPVDRDND
jgi:hypothetical protein